MAYLVRMIRTLMHTWMREMRFALRRARARPGPGVSSVVMPGPGPDSGRELTRVADALSGRAGFAGVSPTFNAPMLLRGGIDVAPRIDGQDAAAARDNPFVGFDAVLPRSFELAGTRIVEGRDFGPQDGPRGAPSIIVNLSAARALWPGRPALGRQVNLGGLSRAEWRTVVGVVEDQRFRTFPDSPRPCSSFSPSPP